MTEIQNVFSKEPSGNVPFWFMRQAGRFLPEYRQLRADTGSFLDMCYSPERACEATMQPIRRFDMSAAIIFSDILVVPDAMGMDVTFVKGEGPKLKALESVKDAEALDASAETIGKFLEPVYEALRLTRAALPNDKSLFGFAGAPWTVACYMLQGKGGKEFAMAREQIYAQPELVERTIAKLEEVIAAHLIHQVDAGADILQIFDSWAAYAPHAHREALIYAPTARIVEKVREVHPSVPIIGFPKGLSHRAAEYVAATGVDGFGVDMMGDIAAVRAALDESIVVQGNLDPLMLASSKEASLAYAKELVESMRGKRFIFNLGHGMVPHTPIENVNALSDYLQSAGSV